MASNLVVRPGAPSSVLVDSSPLHEASECHVSARPNLLVRRSCLGLRDEATVFREDMFGMNGYTCYMGGIEDATRIKRHRY